MVRDPGVRPEHRDQYGCRQGGHLNEQSWDDDTDYQSAVRRMRITMAFALIGTLLVLGIVAVGVLATWLFLAVAEHFSQ